MGFKKRSPGVLVQRFYTGTLDLLFYRGFLAKEDFFGSVTLIYPCQHSVPSAA